MRAFAWFSTILSAYTVAEQLSRRFSRSSGERSAGAPPAGAVWAALLPLAPKGARMFAIVSKHTQRDF